MTDASVASGAGEGSAACDVAVAGFDREQADCRPAVRHNNVNTTISIFGDLAFIFGALAIALGAKVYAIHRCQCRRHRHRLPLPSCKLVCLDRLMPAIMAA